MGKQSRKGSVKAKCLGYQNCAECLLQKDVNFVIKPETAVGVKQKWGIDCAMLGDVNKCHECKISPCQAEDCAVKVCVSQPKGVNTKANFQVQQWLNKVKTDNESQKLQCLAELIQWLKERTVTCLKSFPVQSVVVALVKLLEMNHNFDILNFTCQALKSILDVFPLSSEVVVDAVPILLEEVQCVRNLDVVEQAFAILEILSHTHGRAILLTGELGDCFYDLECFSIQAKRNALAMAAKCCQQIQPNELIAKALPELSQRLTHQDKESVESILLCFLHLINNFQFNQVMLEKVLCPELVSHIQQSDGKGSKTVASLLSLVNVLANSESVSLEGSVPGIQSKCAVKSQEVGASNVPKAKEVKLAAGVQVPTKAVVKEPERGDQSEQVKYIETLKVMYAQLAKAFKEKQSQLEQSQREGVLLKEMHSIEILDKKSEIKSLKESLASEVERNALESEQKNKVVMELQKEVADLTKRLAEASNLHKDTAERQQKYEEKCTELAQANAALHTHVVNLQRQCTELADAKVILAEREKSLQEQLRKDTAERATLELQLNNLFKSHRLLETRLCDCKAQKEDLEQCKQVQAKAMEQLQAQLTVHQTEEKFLRDQNFDLKVERGSLQQRLCMLQDQVLLEEQHRTTILQEMESLKQCVGKKDAEIQLLKEPLPQRPEKLEEDLPKKNLVAPSPRPEEAGGLHLDEVSVVVLPGTEPQALNVPTKLSGGGSRTDQEENLDGKFPVVVSIPQGKELSDFELESPVYDLQPKVKRANDIELSDVKDQEGLGTRQNCGRTVAQIYDKCSCSRTVMPSSDKEVPYAKEQFKDSKSDALLSNQFSPQVPDPVVLTQRSIVIGRRSWLLKGAL
eukprot:XP_004919560.1 PREDICTED: uncharacterized protein LOC101734904 [Xenopus tropicalis]